MSNEFRGTGGPPPTPNSNFQRGQGSKFRKPDTTLIEMVGDKQKTVTPFMVDIGGETTAVTLDREQLNYTVRLHTKFRAFGRTNNLAVCVSRIEGRTCPLCEALGKQGTWYAVATVLSGSSWTVPDGKNKGKVFKDQRRLLLVGYKQLEAIKKIAKKAGAWRGQEWDISRSDDQKSFRIGDLWLPKGAALTEEQLKERYASVAADYGLSVEAYLEPFDYNKVLEPLPHETLVKIAASIKAVATPENAPSEEEIPF